MDNNRGSVYLEKIMGIVRENRDRLIVGFVLAGVLIFIIFYCSGFGDIIGVLVNADWVLVFFSVLLQFIIYLFWTYRWKFILNRMDEDTGGIGFWDLCGMMFISFFANNITPGSGGGELLRAYVLKKSEDVGYDVGFSSTLADRVYEFIPFLVLTIVSLFVVCFWSFSFWVKFVIVFCLILVLVLLGLLIVFGFNTGWSAKLKPLFRPLLEISGFKGFFFKLRGYVGRCRDCLVFSLRDRDLFIMGVFLSIVILVGNVFRYQLCFWSVGVSVDWFVLLVVYTVVVMISVLPVIPGALGVREGVMVVLLGVVGVGAGFTVSAMLIERLSSFFISSVVGVLLSVFYGARLIS